MRAYPLAKRLAVLAARDSGKTTGEVARAFGVSESWVRRVKQHRGQSRRWFRARAHRRAPTWARYEEQIDAIMRKDPETTLRELRAALGTELSLSTLCRALRKLNWSKFLSKAERQEMEDRRASWERSQGPRRVDREVNRWASPYWF